MTKLNVMENLLVYLLQVNVLLSILYIGYYLFLKGLTFYTLNRTYLLLGTLYAFVFPFVNLNAWLSQQISLSNPVLLEYIVIPSTEEVVNSFTLANALTTFITVGIGLFFIKLLIQLFSLARIHYYSIASRWQQYLFRNVLFPVVPFSFFNQIYLHKKHHDNQELTTIFQHEKIHVKGYHSVDVLFFEMTLILCWYNPFVWLMRKSARHNLEYLTDQTMLKNGVDRQNYQYSLLNVNQQGASIAISNQFNFKILKKRIMMMNKRKSSKLALGKYIILVPFLILTGASFTIKKTEKSLVSVIDRAEETQLNEFLFPVASKHQNTLTFQKDTVKSKKVKNDQLDSKKALKIADKPLIILNGKAINDNNFDVNSINPNSIESINVIKDKSAIDTYGEKGKNGVIVITSKNGIEKKSSLKNDTLSTKLNYNNFIVVGEKTISNETKEGNKNKVIVKGLINSMDSTGFDGSKHPLVIVDGKEVANEMLSQLNPASILSISVLKDESAVSAYGEKGKNGVILVSTKNSENSDSETNKIKKKPTN